MSKPPASVKDRTLTGRYVHRVNREVFALRIVPVVDPEFGHTHQAKNEMHFCSGLRNNLKTNLNGSDKSILRVFGESLVHCAPFMAGGLQC